MYWFFFFFFFPWYLSIGQLLTDSVQLYLVHWPIAFAPGPGLFPQAGDGKHVKLDLETSLVDTWKGMSTAIYMHISIYHN